MKISKVAEALVHLTKLKRPVMLWGPPGIGKSQIVAQVAASMGAKLIDKRLSQSDPTELKGYPWPDHTKKVMTFFRDESMPSGKGKGILFLDELPHAPQAVQAVAFQLILDRRIGNYELPADWAVVAAGNRMQDRAGTHAMNSALANRFVHINVEVDPEDWIDWAIKQGISDLTRGYIRYRPANLMTNEIKPGAREFPTPRTWEFADQIIQSSISDEMKLEIISGTLGEGVAAEFVGYCREHASLVNLDRIEMDPEKAPVPESPSACYAVTSALESRAGRANLERLMKYVTRLPSEFQVVFIESVTRSKPELCETKAYTDWIRSNRTMLRK